VLVSIRVSPSPPDVSLMRPGSPVSPVPGLSLPARPWPVPPAVVFLSLSLA
jgi:hypothetical protein